ncbi:MFS transporter [Guptibacillus hwajinpoensis]|uniref:MFS family permease n=1 Tax=Guptibacillus hwajinpoensis TaxID=208199 RepID=A0ABU0K429_9BACL|nr:MFS transporter [Alkalihalobacillus hemicentroti]MDQ0484112.1 MFS family permease [Alkalihalobacillus hemicentroti]
MSESNRYRFFILISIVFISGYSQGMLLPLLSILLEEAGVSSSMNGLNASALYIGILFASPFIEKPVRKFGYKPAISVGLLLVTISVILIPIWQAFWFWFILRVIVGIGDNLLHFATQLWITTTTSKEKRGRNIAIYGSAFGLGFAAGPLSTILVQISLYLPFVIASGIALLTWFMLIKISNEFPDPLTSGSDRVLSKYSHVLKIGWVALLPSFGYGFLEASLHGNFPVYALRAGLDVKAVSILLPAFVVGSLIFQMPLGIWSDKFGRKNVLLISMLIGWVCFSGAIFTTSVTTLFILFFLAGMMVGSLFSLSITYLADLLPNSLLPTGNILAGIFFGIGSILGPYLGGLFIDWFTEGSIFYAISGMLLLLFVATAIHRSPEQSPNYSTSS